MASAALRRNLEELLLIPAPSASFHGRRPRVLTSFEDDYESAYKKSQEQDENAFDEAEGSIDSAAEESAQATEAAAKEVGKEQSGEEEAKKISDMGQTDSARCKDGCRLSNGIGKPLGPPPPEEGFGGAQGSGALGVEFPTGGPGQAPGTQGQGGYGGMAGGGGPGMQGSGGVAGPGGGFGPGGSLGPGGSAGGAGAGGFGGGSGGGGYAGSGPGGEPQLPQEWLDADAARAADDRAVELAQMEAERTGRKFEDIANMDTDDIADDPYALLPRPIFLTQTEFVGPEGTTVGWPPKGATDKWGGAPIQIPVNLASGTMLSRISWSSLLLAWMGPQEPCRARPRSELSAGLDSNPPQLAKLRQQGLVTSFANGPPEKSAEDDLDDSPDDDDDEEEEPPPPGARDKFGGPAMQQPWDKEGPSSEGAMDLSLSLAASGLWPLVKRRRCFREFL